MAKKMVKVRQIVPFFTLYFAQGYSLGFLAVLLPLSGKKAGLSSTAIGIAMTFAMMPTFIKPLLAPTVDLAESKKRRLLFVQSLMVLSAGTLLVLCVFLPTDWLA